jgi:multidrug efflux pump subunit AcrB
LSEWRTQPQIPGCRLQQRVFADGKKRHPGATHALAATLDPDSRGRRLDHRGGDARSAGGETMIGIVRLALRRPYTFIVMAVLILIFGTASALRTPTDIFPNINIPVISVVFSYTGLPADDMAGRIVTFYERSLPNSVNDIEHIESQSIANYGIIKIFFQPTVNINAALAQVNGMSQTVLKQMPPGITPPLILSFNASSVPILQLALSSDKMSETQIFDAALNFIRPALAPVPGAALPLPFGGKVRQVQADLNQQALHQYGVSSNDVINALSLQNLITPVGTQKIGTYEYTVNLNDSPKAVEAFNDLPVKTVNGTVIYMRDVAYVHDGSPPQTNAVHVNGASAVLLTIMKAGTSSTLDIINGVKSLLPSVSQTLPSSLKLTAVGDQSVFVTDAVSSVVKEGVIAAALTGMMILLFLGSWRSTLIITLSIPLAILAALTGLSLLGETINVMTLGGLALAVGILVDDATVTIENINWHLEQGKQIEPAILDGARQIVVPATVSLFCICIAFVPMFGLGGVAGYLFRPLAEAVMLALAASYVLSRTLVPTLANYLLRNQHPHGSSDGADQAPATASRNPLVRFQHGFERSFANVRSAYLGLLQLCLQNRIKLIAGFLSFSLLSFGLAPYLGQDFFPTVDGGQIKLHIRAPTGTRIEETTSLTDRIGSAIHGIVPPGELDGIVSNIGLSVSGINMAYNNSGTIGVGDADILISLKPNHAPTDEYIKAMRDKLPQQFPGTTFAFLPADIVSQVLNFGVPAPIDLQVAGRDLVANRKYANSLLAKVRQIPGIADARIQQAFQQPTLNVNVDRSLTSLAGLTEKDVATAMLTTLSGSSQSAPTYWLNPANGVSYGHRHFCDAAGTRSWCCCLGHSKSYSTDGTGASKRRQRCVTGASEHDDKRLSAAVRRSRGGDRADLPVDCHKLSILGRSVRHYHGVADCVGRHRLGPVRDRDDTFRSRAHRRHHVHGCGDRQQHPGDQLCPRTDASGRGRHGGCIRGGRFAVSPGADDGSRHGYRHAADGDRAGTEPAIGARGDRRADLCHLRHPVSGADNLQPGAWPAASRCESQRP